MLGLNQDDYRKAVAQSLINHNGSIADINKTLNNTLNPNGSSGVIETQANHTTELAAHAVSIGKVLANTFNPAGCTDGSGHHWVFVVGIDNSIYMRHYSGGWSGWSQVGGAFSSGLAAYYDSYASTVHVYGISTAGGDCWHFYMAVSDGIWHSENLGGNSGELGQWGK